jgi:hypothetical protein
MKFGKRIRSEAVEAWSPFYIDYKELKHLLKQLVAKVCRESFSLRWRAARALRCAYVSMCPAVQHSPLLRPGSLMAAGPPPMHMRQCGKEP